VRIPPIRRIAPVRRMGPVRRITSVHRISPLAHADELCSGGHRMAPVGGKLVALTDTLEDRA